MSAKEIIIALDQGSSSSRALALDARGRVLARSQYAVRSRMPRPGWIEHDAENLARTLERALDDVLKKIPANAAVAGIGIAAQRTTFIMWDGKTGKPVLPAPSWMDARASELVAPMQRDLGRQEQVHDRTGLYLTPFYSAPKIRHQLDRSKKARKLAEQGRLRIGPVSTYLLWRLTRGEVFRTEPTMAQRMLLYNLTQRDWDGMLLELFRIPRECLPEIVPSAGHWGEIRRQGRRIPVLAALGDQQSAAIGQGGGAPGVGVLNYGTGAFFLLHAGTRLRHLPGLLTSVACQRKGADPEYFLEGTVHAVGTAFEWLESYLGVLKDIRDVDKACRRSKHPVLALLALGGLGAPRWDYKTPTVFYGLRPQTTPDDIVRGVTEAIAYLIADIVEPMRRAGLDIRELRASGGVARVDHLLRFQAGLLQQPVGRLREREATAMGVARLAAREAGLAWKASGAAVAKVFKPSMSPDNAGACLARWSRFVEAQRRLAETF